MECDNYIKNLMHFTPEDYTILFTFQIQSIYISAKDSNLIINYIPDLTLHNHMVSYSSYLKHKLNLTLVYKVYWQLSCSILKRITQYLHICLSKSLLNFAGTSH